MIVKFFKNSGGGSANAAMNYLLGKENDREGARLLSGDPELTKRLSDSLSFQNRYTVGVLSFEEKNLPDNDKRAIMESFESSLLAGLDKDQYNMTWIEHTDKDRLELNFVIANVELTTGKRLQPYFDRADRPLVENWKQVTNHEYGLTDPHDPDKTQAVKTLNRQKLPKAVQQIKAQIGQAVAHQIEQGNITDRKGVIDTLEQAGFEITRTTDKSISIKNPEGKRNIRLEGVIYENRQLGKELGEDTAEQDKIMQEQVQSVTKQHLASYNALLRSSKNETEQALAENINLIKQSKSSIQQALAYKTMLGGLMGVLLTTLAGLFALIAWTGIDLKNKKAELAEITAKIEQSPLEAKALTQVEILEQDGMIYIATKEGVKARNFNNETSHVLEIK